MLISIKRHFRHPLFCALVSMLTCQLSFAVPGVASTQASQGVALPEPGTLVMPSADFYAPVLKGVQIHPDQPFHFEFIVDQGDQSISLSQLEAESYRLIKYFMAALAVPEQDMWVNLSPNDHDRAIPDKFALTAMGRDLLAQDYLLKQLSASMMYPEHRLGEDFWQRVRHLAHQRLGVTDIPVNTFNKVWIVPERAVVYQDGYTAYVSEGRLKVMLQSDYQASASSPMGAGNPDDSTDRLAQDIYREVIIPELEREVNTGRQFARLRQIYHSLILATWYREVLEDSLINQVYAGQNKIHGIEIDDPRAKDAIYQQYMDAFRKGVYNYIREDYDQLKDQVIPRQYMSGGMQIVPRIEITDDARSVRTRGDLAMVSTQLNLRGANRTIEIAADLDDSIFAGMRKNGRPKVQLTHADHAELKGYRPDGETVTLFTSLRQRVYGLEISDEGELTHVYPNNKKDKPVAWAWIRDDAGRRTGIVVGDKRTHASLGYGTSAVKINGWIDTPIIASQQRQDAALIRIGPQALGKRQLFAVLPPDAAGETLAVRYEDGFPTAVRLRDGTVVPVGLIRNQYNQVIKATNGSAGFVKPDRETATSYENIRTDAEGIARLGFRLERVADGAGWASLLVDQSVVIAHDIFDQPRHQTYGHVIRNHHDVIIAAAWREPDQDQREVNPKPLMIVRDLQTHRPKYSAAPTKFKDTGDAIVTGRRLSKHGKIYIGGHSLSLGATYADAPVELLWLPSQGYLLVDVLSERDREAFVFDLNRDETVTAEQLTLVDKYLSELGLEWYLDPAEKAYRYDLINELMSDPLFAQLNLRLFSTHPADLQTIQSQLTVRRHMPVRIWDQALDIAARRIDQYKRDYPDQVVNGKIPMRIKQSIIRDVSDEAWLMINAERPLTESPSAQIFESSSNETDAAMTSDGPTRADIERLFKAILEIYRSYADGELEDYPTAMRRLEALAEQTASNPVLQSFVHDRKNPIHVIEFGLDGQLVARDKLAQSLQDDIRDMELALAGLRSLDDTDPAPVTDAYPAEIKYFELINKGRGSTDSDAAMAGIDTFVAERITQLQDAVTEREQVTPNTVRHVAGLWLKALIQEWDYGRNIVHTRAEAVEIGERLNRAWKAAGFDKVRSWPAQVMLMGSLQVSEDKYFQFEDMQEALIEHATREEKILAYWTKAVRSVSHLRYYGNHPEDEFEDPLVDQTVIQDTARKYITLLLEDAPEKATQDQLWGLIVLLDPFIYHPDFLIDQWAKHAYKQPNDHVMTAKVLDILKDLNAEQRQRFQQLARRAFAISDDEWAAAGFRSPYTDFIIHTFNERLDHMMTQMSIKSSSEFSGDHVQLMARSEEFFDAHVGWYALTRDPRAVREMMFSNKRHARYPEAGFLGLRQAIVKRRLFKAMEQDPRHYYRRVFAHPLLADSPNWGFLSELLSDEAMMADPDDMTEQFRRRIDLAIAQVGYPGISVSEQAAQDLLADYEQGFDVTERIAIPRISVWLMRHQIPVFQSYEMLAAIHVAADKWRANFNQTVELEVGALMSFTNVVGLPMFGFEGSWTDAEVQTVRRIMGWLDGEKVSTLKGLQARLLTSSVTFKKRGRGFRGIAEIIQGIMPAGPRIPGDRRTNAIQLVDIDTSWFTGNITFPMIQILKELLLDRTQDKDVIDEDYFDSRIAVLAKIQELLERLVLREQSLIENFATAYRAQLQEERRTLLYTWLTMMRGDEEILDLEPDDLSHRFTLSTDDVLKVLRDYSEEIDDRDHAMKAGEAFENNPYHEPHFDLIDNLELAERSNIVMIGAAENPQAGLAFAMRGHHVRSITKDIKGPTVEAALQESLEADISGRGGRYVTNRETDYLDVDIDAESVDVYVVPAVLDDPRTVQQDLMLDKMLRELRPGGHLVLSFIINASGWERYVERFAASRGFELEKTYDYTVSDAAVIYRVVPDAARQLAAMASEIGAANDEAMLAFSEFDNKIGIDPFSGRLSVLSDEPVFVPAFELWAVRHGETAGNVQRIFQGATDTSINQLNQRGREQAAEAARLMFEQLEAKLRAGDHVVILTSEFARAKETAQAFVDFVEAQLGDASNLTIVEDAGVNEIDFGELNNLSEQDELTDRQRTFIDQYRYQKNARAKPAGGESYLELTQRVHRWLKELNQRYADQTVVMFGHGTFLSAVRMLTGDTSMNDASGQLNWSEHLPANATPLRIGGDTAMTAAKPDAVGGIDFTGDRLNIQLKRDADGIPLPMPVQPLRHIQIDGLVPVILDIRPINVLPLFVARE